MFLAFPVVFFLFVEPVNAAFRQAIDEKPLMLVLREDQRIWKGTQAFADIAQCRARGLPASDPEIDAADLSPALFNDIGKSHLLVELERAGMDD